MTTFELLALLGLILTSAYMSSSELALFSLSRFDVKALKERIKPKTYRNIKRLIGDPGGLLITILVINEIVNISMSTIVADVVARASDSGAFWTRFFPGAETWVMNMVIGTLITTPLVLVLGEITPKVIGARANQLVAALNSNTLATVYTLAKPVRFLLQWLVRLVARNSAGVGHGARAEEHVVRESDFLLMMEEGRREGAIHQNEFELIKNVFELDDATAEQIYTPAHLVQTVSENATLKEALALVRKNDYSRIPITSTTNRRQIVGILYSKDLLRAKLQPELQEMRVTSVMRKPLFVPPSLRLNSLFRKFKQQRTHMAVVQKASGECLGIVTMKDVLDALFDDMIPTDLTSLDELRESERGSS